MKTRDFTIKSKLPGGADRTISGQQVEIPAGRSAFDLETGKTVKGPAKIWQAIRPATAETPEAEATVENEPRRGRPPGKKTAVPPDL
jgi:hypothetical protein